MYDENELFAAALGLQPPYIVDRVDFDLEKQELHLYLDFPRGSEFPCPECKNQCKAYDTKSRQWRHLNFFEHQTYLHAFVPRINCSQCGVKVIEVPWSRQPCFN